MDRKLFCEISPFCYFLSVWKGRFFRYCDNLMSGNHFASTRSKHLLPVLVEKHKSLIRRKLGNVDPELQENKSVNLALAAPRISGVIIRPGETFSFWRLVGLTSAGRGYRSGLMIRHGKPDRGIGGGLCQMSNLIHWLVLHSPLEITEHHHHDAWDLFPDFGRQVPFGVGTSVSHNYLDYRFRNTTDQSFQLILFCGPEYLCGELRAERELPVKYHIRLLEEFFMETAGKWYRHNRIARKIVEKSTGHELSSEIIKESHALVMYDPSLISKEKKVSNKVKLA